MFNYNFHLYLFDREVEKKQNIKSHKKSKVIKNKYKGNQ